MDLSHVSGANVRTKGGGRHHSKADFSSSKVAPSIRLDKKRRGGGPLRIYEANLA